MKNDATPNETPTAHIKIRRSVFNEVFLPYLENDKRYEVIYGGAGSGKSWFVAQKKVYQHLNDKGRKTLVIRKVGNTLRHSVFSQIKQTISEWGVGDLFDVPKGKTNFDIYGPNGNQFIFSGLDDVEKLKSIVGITDIWIEEASEISDDDFTQLDLRLRGKAAFPKQITLTFNPISALSWLKKRFFDVSDKEKISILKTTYLDNKFIDDEYREMIESLKDIDPVMYKIYGLGDWGVLGNLILTNWEVKDVSQKPRDYDQVLQGMDFGYNHPSAFLRIGLKDGELNIFQEVYERKLTNQDFIDLVKPLVTPNDLIIADNAEPDRIEEFNRNNLNVVGAKKGPDSVRAGIEWLRRHKINIHPSCINAIKEIQGWKYKEDKDGNVLDEPVPFKDDAMAALRYAVEPLRSGIELVDSDVMAMLARSKIYR